MVKNKKKILTFTGFCFNSQLRTYILNENGYTTDRIDGCFLDLR